MSDRQCGECSLCCKVLGISVLNKPTHQWCQYVKLGKGCTIYETRPDECRTFHCAWLEGQVDISLHPLKTKVVISIQKNENLGVSVVLYEDVAGIALKNLAKEIKIWQDNGLAVIIFHKGVQNILMDVRRYIAK